MPSGCCSTQSTTFTTSVEAYRFPPWKCMKPCVQTRKGIVKVAGPDRREVPMKGLEFPTSSVLSYWWISYNPGLKTFTGKSDNRGVVVFDSPEFRATKWFRGTDSGLV